MSTTSGHVTISNKKVISRQRSLVLYIVYADYLGIYLCFIVYPSIGNIVGQNRKARENANSQNIDKMVARNHNMNTNNYYRART